MEFKVFINKAEINPNEAPNPDFDKIKEKVLKILSQTPFPWQHKQIKRIPKGEGFFRLRVGNFRVFYNVEGSVVKVFSIRRRNEKTYR